MNSLVRKCLVLALTLGACTLLAQDPPPAGRGGRGGRGNFGPPVPSYEVHPDRTVTLHLRAPDAKDVKLAGDFLEARKDMDRNETGIWSITVGPLRPAIYNYTFVVDGVATIDPVNPMVKLGDRSHESMFEVPADQLQPYDFQPIPHGTVHIDWYQSKSIGAPRSVFVYTPPGYESGSAKFPALYLLHGSGDTEDGWTTVGRANFILDSLIAAGKAKPMIVVMPYGQARPNVYFSPKPAGQQPPDRNAYENDVINDVMPLVEKMYRISAKPDDRAIAGLSMGGGQALQIGLAHLDRFHAIGAFSAAISNQPEETYKDALADPAATNKKLKLFYIACGKADRLFPASQNFDQTLVKHEIKHTFVPSEEGHVWRNWRDYLAEFAPKLFR